MIFTYITFIAAFLIEGLGTYVSVIGLSTLFGSNPIIIALAIALDLGKIVVVSLLYKYWDKLGYIMRSYALVAAAVTMTITSAGAAGYLAGEFQKAILGTQEGTLKVDALKAQITKYEERKKQIDASIASIPDRYTANQKIRLMNQFKAEQKDLQNKIAAIDQQLPELQIKQIGVEAKAGPILYIAKAFNIPVESAVKWVILAIIFVFDPLAVFLIIAGNFLLDQRRRSVSAPENVIAPGTIPLEKTITSEPIPEKAVASEQAPVQSYVEHVAPFPKYVDVVGDEGPASLKVMPVDIPESTTYSEPSPQPVDVAELTPLHVMPVDAEEIGYPDARHTKIYTRADLSELPKEKLDEIFGPGETVEPIEDEIVATVPAESKTAHFYEEASRLAEQREQITLSTLGLVKPDSATITDVAAAQVDDFEVGLGTGVYKTGAPPR